MSKNNNKWRYKTGQHLIKKEDKFKILHRDKKAFKSLYICGHVREDQLLTILNPNRIKTYQKEGWIKKVVSPNGKVDFKFTKDGRDFVAKHLGWDQPYIAKSTTHDAILNNKFFSLNEAERESAKSETEVRNELREKAFFTNEDKQKTEDYLKFLEEKTSPVDFVYETIDEETGEVYSVGFEGVTASYTAEDRQMKHNFAHHYGCKLEMRRR